jgi:PadR family transcriptional regulator PadR
MERQFLTDLELMLMLAVMRLGEDAYGVPVARDIKDTTGREIAIAVVYATLDRLESRSLVSSALGDPTAERGGRAKRFFRVTAKGVRQVRDTQRAFHAMWRDLPQLKGRLA